MRDGTSSAFLFRSSCQSYRRAFTTAAYLLKNEVESPGKAQEIKFLPLFFILNCCFFLYFSNIKRKSERFQTVMISDMAIIVNDYVNCKISDMDWLHTT